MGPRVGAAGFEHLVEQRLSGLHVAAIIRMDRMPVDFIQRILCENRDGGSSPKNRLDNRYNGFLYYLETWGVQTICLVDFAHPRWRWGTGEA